MKRAEKWTVTLFKSEQLPSELGGIKEKKKCSGLLTVLFIFFVLRKWRHKNSFCFFPFHCNTVSEYSRLISFRIDWLDLLAVQGTLKSFLHYHSSKPSILRHSTFFIVCLSHLYMTTGKTIALTIWIFVGKVMSLLFNMMSRFVIAFLPRSLCLLIPWLQSRLAVIFGAQGNKICHCFIPPFTYHEVVGLAAMNWVFWMLNFKPAFLLFSFILITTRGGFMLMYGKTKTIL